MSREVAKLDISRVLTNTRSKLLNQIQNNPRKVSCISIVLPIILSDISCGERLASPLGSTSALHHHVIHVKTVKCLQSAAPLRMREQKH